MYLYYYFNEKYVGTVDIEVMFASKNRYTLITTDEKGASLLGSLELMYGRRILSFSPAYVYDCRHNLKGNLNRLPEHIYTTSKVGPVLKWDDREHVLCV